MADCGRCKHDCPAGNPSGHWSHMDCGRAIPHEPHVWDGVHCLYGPYYCVGRK